MKRWLALMLLILAICLLEQPHAAQAVAAGLWRYEIVVGEQARELAIIANYTPVSHLELSVNTDAEAFVKNVEIDYGQGWQPMVQRDTSWFLPPICRTRSFRFRYRYLLAEAARVNDNIEVAKGHNDNTYLSPPSAWLLRPLDDLAGNKIIFQVKTPPNITFVSGVFQSTTGKDTYEANAENVPDLPYSGFGLFRKRLVNLPGGVVEIAIASGEFELGDSVVINWITTSARAISNYYGRFPIKRVLVLVRPSSGRGIGFGTTMGNGGASISIVVGRATRQSTFDNDWVMTHELVHCGFPSVPRNRHAWAEEGLATYVEPWARIRVGALSAEKGWRDVVRDMPQGLPSYGDRGLDYTRSWGRVYWGGALFYLVADVEIRARTNNRRGLEDALRAIAAAGGTVDANWDLERTLVEGDKAIGVPVLTELYQKMRAKPVNVDLDELWRKLGVEQQGDSISFNDRAPLASIRRAITNGKNNNRAN